MNLNKNITKYDLLVRAYKNASKLFRFVCIYLSPIIFLILFSTSVNIYISLSIVLLFAYFTRVAWVYSVGMVKVYQIVYKHYEKERNNLFK